MTVPGHFVGVDVGGTKVAVATLDDGRLSDSRVVPTRKGSSDELVDQLGDVIEEARTSDTLAVGLGVPAAIEFVNGIARLAEAANHHPDLDIRYRKVRVALTTHDEGGITALTAPSGSAERPVHRLIRPRLRMTSLRVVMQALCAAVVPAVPGRQND